MYRVGIITDKGKVIGKNFNTRDEVDDFILGIMETQGVKFYKIKDKTTGKIIETETGKTDEKKGG